MATSQVTYNQELAKKNPSITFPLRYRWYFHWEWSKAVRCCEKSPIYCIFLVETSKYIQLPSINIVDAGLQKVQRDAGHYHVNYAKLLCRMQICLCYRTLFLLCLSEHAYFHTQCYLNIRLALFSQVEGLWEAVLHVHYHITSHAYATGHLLKWLVLFLIN